MVTIVTTTEPIPMMKICFVFRSSYFAMVFSERILPGWLGLGCKKRVFCDAVCHSPKCFQMQSTRGAAGRGLESVGCPPQPAIRVPGSDRTYRRHKAGTPELRRHRPWSG